jgi:major membrane immunogen (membrane-anchored lipoprotein)
MSLKKILPLIISVLILSACGTSDPKTLANEYCDCIKNASQESDFQLCQDLAREHKDKLGNDNDQLQKYSDELVNCTNVSR